MKICIATQEFGPFAGGIATLYNNLVRIILQQHEVVVLTVDFTHPGLDDLVQQQGKLTVVTLRKSYGARYEQWKSLVRKGNREAATWIALGLAMKDWLRQWAASWRIDRIETPDYGGLAYFISDPALPPVSVCGHGSFSQLIQYDFREEDINKPLISFFEKSAFGVADAVIAHSRSNAQSISRVFGAAASLCTPPWLSPDPVKPLPLGKPTDIIVIGRLQQCKGAIVMNEALRICRAQGAGLHVWWIGGDTWTAPGGMTCSRYLRRNFPEIWNKNFQWLDTLPREKMLSLLPWARMVAVPSLFESLGMAALEAASFRRPLVISRGAGIGDYFTDGADAMLAEAGNAEDLAACILRLHNSLDTCMELAANALATVHRQFQPAQALADRLAVWEGMEKKNTEEPDPFAGEADINPQKAYKKLKKRLNL